MEVKRFFPEKLFIEESCLKYPFTEKIINKLNFIPRENIKHSEKLVEEMCQYLDPISEGKKYLLIKKQTGNFVKSCPCTPQYLGCNYFIINLDINCPMDCSYCILQDYLSNPMMTIHANHDDMKKELDIFLNKAKNKYIRIGTGELGDSLALDHITDNSKMLISYFRNKQDVLFELKTKSVNIDNIMNLKPVDNVIIAWSLNSKKMAVNEEKGTPSVEQRIQAAKAVTNKGYKVAFHFDPIIHYSGWEIDYEVVINELFDQIQPVNITWISLGSLRFPSELKKIISKRFPYSKIIYDEFIRGKDGKLRYFKFLRIDMYQKIKNYIEKNGGKDIPLYFCMESKEIWSKVFKKRPKGKKQVSSLFFFPNSLPFDK